jgi:hypothetical protein
MRPTKNPAGSGRGSLPTNGLFSGDTHQMMIAESRTSASTRATPSTAFKAKLDPLPAWLMRGRSEVFTVVADVTPDLAERLLALNVENRPVRWNGALRCVEAYAKAMQRGDWRINGEAIIVSSEGLLNDGQHRLHAVVASGMAVPMQITFGVDRESRHTVDQGAARTPGNILAMRGEANTNQLAHAIQFMFCYDGQRVFGYRPSSDELLQVLDAHPHLRDAVRDVGPLAREFRVSPGYLGGSLYVCRRVNPIIANAMLDGVHTGLDIRESGSPVFRLRKRFQDHLAGRERILALEQAALYIKAFNAIAQRRNVRNLLWRQNGPAAEAFPTAEG